MANVPVPSVTMPRRDDSPVAAISPRHLTARERGVTRRVVLLCLSLAVFFGALIPVIDAKLQNTFLGAQHLPVGAVAVLLAVLLLLNPALKRLAFAAPFSRNETLTVYISCLFSCLVPGHGSESFFVPNLLGVFYYATRDNKWFSLWAPHFKAWLTPALSPDGSYNRAVVEGWYNGLAPGQSIPWGAWLVPLLVWGALVGAIYSLMACLSVMLRAQWGEREVLGFPLLTLPLEMTQDMDGPPKGKGSGFFANPMLWIGFGVAVFIEGINGLARYFPDVPAVPLSLAGNYFSEPPWNQIDAVPLVVFPITVGITFLLTSEVSFSIWFFYWFIKLQYIVAFYWGFQPNTLPGAPESSGKLFTGFQHIGAYVAYVALTLWAGREHFGHIARRAFGRDKARRGEDKEALSYPVAFWGFVASFAFVLAWSYAAGIGLSLALLLWGSYLVMIIGLSRLVAEGGFLILENGWRVLGTAGQIIGAGAGTWLSPANGVLQSELLQGIFMVDMRGFLMPSFVQGFKLAHDRGIAAKPLLRLIATVTLVSFSLGVWMNVQLGYENGGTQLHPFFASIGPRMAAWNSDSLLRVGPQNDWKSALWLLVGAALIYAMVVGRAYFPTMPFHPLGYLLCLTNVIHSQWLSVFIGWTCKVLIMRFGGVDAYRRLVPAFLGLVLGEVTMILFWLLVDGWFGRTGHQLLPG